jgi:cysteine sulfinate desulfinase/cysteine desulfurase-like protein
MQKLIPGFKRTLEMDRTSPFIAHYMTMPFQGAILTRALHKYGISVAPGSACESETPGGSAVLSAMGFSAKDSYCCLRFSFSRANTADEIRECVNRLAECVKDY